MPRVLSTFPNHRYPSTFLGGLRTCDAGEMRGDRQLQSSPSQAYLGTRCDARPRRLISATQHESILTRSHEGVLEYRDIVVTLSLLLHRLRRGVVGLWRGDECEGVLRQDSRGWRDIMVRWAVEQLCMRLI